MGIEGIFGEDGAKMIKKILPVKSSWTKTAANYVFDMEDNARAMDSKKHLHEKSWSAMAFDGENTHAMEDAILADREKLSVPELFQLIRKNKKVKAAEAVREMKRRLRATKGAAGHPED